MRRIEVYSRVAMTRASMTTETARPVPVSNMGSRPVTLPERRAREGARRRGAAGLAIGELRVHAGRAGGRYVVFGSYAADAMTDLSDLDVLIDFPADAGETAWTFVEELARRVDLPIDLHDARHCERRFVERVRAEGIVLP